MPSPCLSPPTTGSERAPASHPDVGALTSSKDLAKKLDRVKPYLTGQGHQGGITLSGGEPLLQVSWTSKVVG